MELLILGAVGIWLVIALRFCIRRKGGCGGDCTHCKGCK